MFQLATAHLEETRAHPIVTDVSPGFRLAFGDYMEGNALSFVSSFAHVYIVDLVLILH